jgi:molybdenum cofactor cytidylyltransferase
MARSTRVHPRQRIGLLLAAGRSRRMGLTKQLMPWPSPAGEQPLVAAAYDAIKPMCDEMIVVLGHEAQAVAAALGARPFHQVLGDPDAAMSESIRAGLEAALRIDPRATVVLQPGDHPAVAEETLRALIAAAAAQPDYAVMPEHGGQGGHPVLIPPSVVGEVLRADFSGGLRQFWRIHPELCVRLPVDDPRVVRDVDTPEQLGE